MDVHPLATLTLQGLPRPTKSTISWQGLPSRQTLQGSSFGLKNPKRSWMWVIEGFKTLAAKPGVHMHSLQLCMFGGTRPKWSAFLTNIPAFAGIVKTCDCSHSHAPWAVPPLGEAGLDLAIERGFKPPPTRHEAPGVKTSGASQGRSGKLLELRNIQGETEQQFPEEKRWNIL